MTEAPPQRLDEQGRPEPPLEADDKTMLEAFLDFQRATVLWKAGGVSDHDLRRPASPPSTLSILGVVKHLAYVEQWWFLMRFAGEDWDVPWTDTEPDADFRIEPGETTERILDLYRDRCKRSRAVVRAASLDDLERRSRWDEHVSLRWILVHMIEETARHNGHIDLLREAIDGLTGE